MQSHVAMPIGVKVCHDIVSLRSLIHCLQWTNLSRTPFGLEEWSVEIGARFTKIQNTLIDIKQYQNCRV